MKEMLANVHPNVLSAGPTLIPIASASWVLQMNCRSVYMISSPTPQKRSLPNVNKDLFNYPEGCPTATHGFYVPLSLGQAIFDNKHGCDIL